MPDVRDFRRDFPLLKQTMNGRPIVYLDNSATTQKPESVIRAIGEYYGSDNANPHRGAYALSIKATDIYENARERARRFIGADDAREIIFTRNTTESLNLVAYSYGLNHIGPGDEILLTIAEHHS
ncbi:MAG: aminotransferase class V-fold PLP-dependent enzyme, partial [Negativicutes bacterium]